MIFYFILGKLNLLEEKNYQNRWFFDFHKYVYDFELLKNQKVSLKLLRHIMSCCKFYRTESHALGYDNYVSIRTQCIVFQRQMREPSVQKNCHYETNTLFTYSQSNPFGSESTIKSSFNRETRTLRTIRFHSLRLLVWCSELILRI